LQPLARYPLDAAILFSDILTIPDAMGLGLSFAEGEGPRFEKRIGSAADVAALGVPDPEGELRYVMDATRLIRRELDGRVPLIGFAGSPWTLACYMVEGGSSSTHARIKALLLDDPAALHALLDLLARSVTTYLAAQLAAGAQALMVFDTWGGVLSPGHYREFSLHYLRAIAQGLERGAGADRVPLILFSKGVHQLDAIAATGCEAVGLDWTSDLALARAAIGSKVALQGNLDPATLHARPDSIREAVAATLAAYGHGSGHVFNLGHGITPDVEPERLAVLIEAVHAFSPQYHVNS
jgi:uroporphyrinogen decarboxylase